ncbi:4-hydroxythreonine-4-phosphate dehydrogenase [Helicobacter sp. 11S02629-2]|uniref:4-hydroxythreonine-4-phosphate dehydrogenase n=1 Tax=Helicobacter sp. 11S02629-2 TaxID=1476195 RepID=UPI000BA70D12|nr:4-hydroxythreonine-4-phosphate dehydrogenase [Helicobacter sp. 11S02629-2]PAF44927.1 hypothetical protein BKH40_04370 [Helicobacter sp. 11S02629-2]
MSKLEVAVSIGDINGVGLQIALQSHAKLSMFCKPFYMCDYPLLQEASTLLNLKNPILEKDCLPLNLPFKIKPGKIDSISGAYSFASFKKALEVSDRVLTLPIHKKAWQLAGANYAGHTEYLRELYGEGIMMLGCPSMFVALFSDHVPLKEVSSLISKESFKDFLLRFYKDYLKGRDIKEVCVLGFNPHAGDGGVLGDEDFLIQDAIKELNLDLGKDLFIGPYPPDAAFIPSNRARFSHFISIYHDAGLIPLKALYFEESINVTLGLPIKRASVDHGVAFDIAYKGAKVNTKSYINAAKFLV